MASTEHRTPQLPVELLGLIANLLRPNDVLMFRLASKTFADVSFDRFAYLYIDELSCFFPDPARVQRFANITSQPHLVDRIQAIFLTVDAFEYNHEEVNFVTPAHDRGDALFEYKSTYQRQELKYHWEQPQNLDLLSQSLERLNTMRCQLHLDLSNRTSFHDYTEWALLSQSVLAAIERASCPIYGLAILPMRSSRIGAQEMQGILPRYSPYLELYCTPIHSEGLDDSEFEALMASTDEVALETMSRAVEDPRDSESLDIIYWIWPYIAGPTTFFANHVLSSDNSTLLKRLTLVNVLLPTFDDLFRLFRRCEGTFEIIALDRISIATDRHGWKSLFEILAGMPKLLYLHTEKLWWERPHEHGLLIVDDDNLEFRFQAVGISSIKAALVEILKRGYAVRKGSERIRLW